MREKERIKRILKLIEKLWDLHPDMRLGQLLENYGGFRDGSNWNTEDSDTEKYLKAYLEELE